MSPGNVGVVECLLESVHMMWCDNSCMGKRAVMGCGGWGSQLDQPAQQERREREWQEIEAAASQYLQNHHLQQQQLQQLQHNSSSSDTAAAALAIGSGLGGGGRCTPPSPAPPSFCPRNQFYR